MRKTAIFAAAAILVTVTAAPSEARFGFRARGGFSRIAYSDFNDYVEMTNTQLSGFAEMDEIRWIPEIGGEFTFAVLPTLTGAVGAGYLTGKSDFGLSLGGDGLSYSHELRSIPLTATAYWEPPLPFFEPFVFGGVGLYHTRLEFAQRVIISGSSTGFEAELTDWGFGLHGGAGIRFAIVPAVGFEIGLSGRWADLSGFEGTATNLEGDSYDAYLVSDTVEDPQAGSIEYYGPWDSGDDYEEGSVDLTGFTIFIGVSAGF